MMKKAGRNVSGKGRSGIGFSLFQTTIVIILSLAINIWPGIPHVNGAELQDVRKNINFNRNWKFYKGEQEGAEAIDFNDSQWQAVRLPHDWAIAGPFDPNSNGSTGKLPWQERLL
ncbi:hypothetical protein JW935_27340 [candidate division KSB1 bacterium]|nr:hypothetical protein [candidate division KSB1 bacterium]